VNEIKSKGKLVSFPEPSDAEKKGKHKNQRGGREKGTGWITSNAIAEHKQRKQSFCFLTWGERKGTLRKTKKGNDNLVTSCGNRRLTRSANRFETSRVRNLIRQRYREEGSKGKRSKGGKKGKKSGKRKQGEKNPN